MPEPGTILADDCPKIETHTASPSGYIAKAEWAERMGKTHHQVRCDGCGMLSIWVPNVAAGRETECHTSTAPPTAEESRHNDA